MYRDIAFREAHELARNSSLLSIQRRGILLINLAGLEMSNGLYEATIESLQRAMAVLLPDHFVHYGYALSTNLGISYLELGQRDAARDWFEKALIVATGHPIHAVNGLAHTAMLEGRSDEMRHWSHEAFTAMWDSLMSFETEEMAHLTEVLGHMALHLGDGRLAGRLFDQAQNLCGHSGLWNRWRRLNRTLVMAEAMDTKTATGAVIGELGRFTVLLECMLAQELVLPRASKLADIRLFIARRIAEAMGFGPDQMTALTYVCRLADLGLSAVSEPEPETGNARMAKMHSQHPAMSVRLLDRLGLPDLVLAGIRDHHERWDGQGFPDGKSGTSISLLGRIFAISDMYARQAIVHGAPHSAIMHDIENEAGKALDPSCVAGLQEIFRRVECQCGR